MQESGHKRSSYDLASSGIKDAGRVFWNLTVPELYEEIARRKEGVFSREGALIVDTGEHTGRSAKDKAIVREASSEEEIWWGEVNKEFSQKQFNVLRLSLIHISEPTRPY